MVRDLGDRDCRVFPPFNVNGCASSHLPTSPVYLVHLEAKQDRVKEGTKKETRSERHKRVSIHDIVITHINYSGFISLNKPMTHKSRKKS